MPRTFTESDLKIAYTLGLGAGSAKFGVKQAQEHNDLEFAAEAASHLEAFEASFERLIEGDRESIRKTSHKMVLNLLESQAKDLEDGNYDNHHWGLPRED